MITGSHEYRGTSLVVLFDFMEKGERRIEASPTSTLDPPATSPQCAIFEISSLSTQWQWLERIVMTPRMLARRRGLAIATGSTSLSCGSYSDRREADLRPSDRPFRDLLEGASRSRGRRALGAGRPNRL